MGARAVCILVVLALLAPGAQAAAASGRFVAVGEMGLPAGAREEVTARGAYLDAREDGFREFRIEARTMLVQRYEVRFQEVRTVSPVPRLNVLGTAQSYNYTLHDVVVTLAEGDHAGWAGLYLPPAGGALSLAAGRASTLEGKVGITLGEGFSGFNEAKEGPHPWIQGYDWTSSDPLLLLEADGELRQEGFGEMKLQGPDLRFDARENATTWATGSEAQGEGAVGERFSRWFFLTYEDAKVTLSNPGATRVAASAAEVSWSGVATFRPVEGSLRTPDASYAPTGAPVDVAGDLATEVAPLPAGQDVWLRLDISGDLERTTLRREGGGAVVPLGARPEGLTLLVGTFLLAGITVLVVGALRRRKKKPPVLAAEDRLALARMEAGRERFQEAVTHVREARAQAPTSVRLLLEEASYLGAMGRLEEALRHYEEAAALDPEGDAHFQAAVLLLQSGGDAARAEALLVKALARSPILVLDALYDVSGTFDALRGRPAYEAAVAQARRAMGEA